LAVTNFSNWEKREEEKGREEGGGAGETIN